MQEDDRYKQLLISGAQGVAREAGGSTPCRRGSIEVPSISVHPKVVVEVGSVGSGVIKVEDDCAKCLREVIAYNQVALLDCLVIEVIFLGNMPFGAEHEVCTRFGDDIVRKSMA
jgi:hypothetical protein